MITHYTLTRQETGAIYVGFLRDMTDNEARRYCASGGDLYAWDTETIDATTAGDMYNDCETFVVNLFRQSDHVPIWSSAQSCGMHLREAVKY